MAGKPWTREHVEYVASEYRKGELTPAQIAKVLDRTVIAVRNKAQEIGVNWGTGFTIERPATVNRPIEDVLADQSRNFAEKQSRWDSKHSGIPVKIEGGGPYAIAFIGDPHVDDDGFDFARFSHDVQVVRGTPRMFALNMGDLTNNWIGRLERLFAVQHVTFDEAMDAAQWVVGCLDWIAVILGNHDKWRPIAELHCKNKGVLHVSHGAVFEIECDGRALRVDARHDHKGRSMFNPSHAQLKRNFRGSDCDIVIGAHTHQSAYTLVKNGVTGKIGHCIRVGSYKRFDEFADQLGLDDESISPSVCCVVDPAAPPESYVTVFHDLAKGAEYLGFLRSKHGKEGAA